MVLLPSSPLFSGSLFVSFIITKMRVALTESTISNLSIDLFSKEQLHIFFCMKTGITTQFGFYENIIFSIQEK